jgi:hypothetical protein
MKTYRASAIYQAHDHPDTVNSIDARGTGGGNLVNILCVDQIAGLTAGSDGAVDDVREGLIDLSGFGKTSISRPAVKGALGLRLCE